MQNFFKINPIQWLKITITLDTSGLFVNDFAVAMVRSKADLAQIQNSWWLKRSCKIGEAKKLNIITDVLI